MKRKIKIINIIAIGLFAIQVLGYIGNQNKDIYADTSESIAFYIGYNFFLITSLILFFIAYILKRKVKKKSISDIIDSIGKED